MSKEIKIGLSVIGALLLILGGALYWRLSYSKPGMVVDAELLRSSDKMETSTSSKSAAQDQLAETASSANHWAQPAERSGADYRRVSALGASGETGDAQSANATSTNDDAAADQPSADQQVNVGADSDAGAADPFQQRRAAAVTSSSQTDVTDDAAPQQFDAATATESPLANQNDPSTAADTTGDHPSAIPVAAREPIAPARSIARNSKLRPVAQTNQQMIPDETAVAAPRTRRSYLQDEEAQQGANTDDVYQESSGAAPADGISSRVEVADGKYTVQPNDNYWVISEKLYGNAGYFKALQAFNRARFPQHASELAVGDTIAAPAADELMKAYPNLCPKQRKLPPEHLAKQASSRHPLGAKVYVVEEGDTLFDVARYKLGKASRWSEIYDLNRDVLGEDFDYLKPGTQLVLPTERRTEDRMTRQPTTRKLR